MLFNTNPAGLRHFSKAYITPRRAHHALDTRDHERVARRCEAAGREHVHLRGQARAAPPRVSGARSGVAHAAFRAVDLSEQALHRWPACGFFFIVSVSFPHVRHTLYVTHVLHFAPQRSQSPHASHGADSPDSAFSCASASVRPRPPETWAAIPARGAS